MGALLAALSMTALAGCGQRTQAQEAADERLVAAALERADDRGVSFTMQERLVLTGGNIPKGRAELINSQAAGLAATGNLAMIYRVSTASGSQHVDFQVRIVDSQLYVQGPSGVWKTVPATAATALYPGVSLALVRETVLLARSTSAYSLVHLSSGFTHEYKITPGPDQVEQLQSMPVQGGQEKVFLKTAHTEVDAYLSVPGSRLVRIVVQMTGRDPVSSLNQQVDATVDFSQGRQVALTPPPGAIPSAPADLFATGPAPASQ